ncbi:MAG: hypothetical protein BGO09_10330 [Bacteroidetes bacterium 47-18]|nr:MAG: hypothetical protein BGO09_10330 [Bacteroidetes bacterium 47-18]
MQQTLTFIKGISIYPETVIRRGAKLSFALIISLRRTDGIPVLFEIENTAEKHLSIIKVPDNWSKETPSTNKWTGIENLTVNDSEITINGFEFHNINQQPDRGAAHIKIRIVNRKYPSSDLCVQVFD